MKYDVCVGGWASIVGVRARNVNRRRRRRFRVLASFENPKNITLSFVAAPQSLSDFEEIRVFPESGPEGGAERPTPGPVDRLLRCQNQKLRSRFNSLP